MMVKQKEEKGMIDHQGIKEARMEILMPNHTTEPEKD